MKQKSVLSVFIATFMFSGTVHAINPSPMMRGEITQTVNQEKTADLLTNTINILPTPSIKVTNIKTIPTVLIPATKDGSILLDVTLLDEFLEDVAPNARHYPPNFPTRTAEYLTSENVKHLSDWLESYASAQDASFEVVMRAAKINGMARNLNIGVDYSLRASEHMQKAIKMQPDHAEANFLFGMMISESGGFKEGRKYLDKAASLGYLEAEQSIAQADLLSDKKTAALSRLKSLQKKHPDNKQLSEQIKIVESGGYYIWNIKDDVINVKPIK